MASESLRTMCTNVAIIIIFLIFWLAYSGPQDLPSQQKPMLDTMQAQERGAGTAEGSGTLPVNDGERPQGSSVATPTASTDDAEADFLAGNETEQLDYELELQSLRVEKEALQAEVTQLREQLAAAKAMQPQFSLARKQDPKGFKKDPRQGTLKDARGIKGTVKQPRGLKGNGSEVKHLAKKPAPTICMQRDNNTPYRKKGVLQYWKEVNAVCDSCVSPSQQQNPAVVVGQVNPEKFKERTKLGKPKIALLSYFNRNIFNIQEDMKKHMLLDGQQSRRMYCKLHGYDFIHEDKSVLYPGRQPHWGKIVALAHYLPKYDWILYLDADTVITNLNRTVEDLIDKYTANGEDLVYSRDLKFMNSGVLLIRNSDLSKYFLKRSFFQTKDTWHLQDQGAMEHTLKTDPRVQFRKTNFSREANASDLNNYLPGYCVVSKSKVIPHRPTDFILHGAGMDFCIKWDPMFFRSLAFETAARNAQLTYFPWDEKQTRSCCEYVRRHIPDESDTILDPKAEIATL